MGHKINDPSTLGDCLQRLQSECLKLLNGREDTQSKDLYHYTNLESCRNILETGKLRLTDVRYCNDPDEIQSGLRLLNKVHDELYPNYLTTEPLFANLMSFLVGTLNLSTSFHNDKNFSEKVYRVRRDLEAIGVNPSIFENKLSPIYVACFTERDDDLRQWMPYAEDGQGVAMGFKGFNVGHEITIDDLWLIKTCYEPDEKKEDYVRNTYSRLLETYKEMNPNLLGNFAGKVHVAFLHDIIASKSSNYKDEEEWRIFRVDVDENMSHDLKFSVSRNILKPYYEIDINKTAVVDVKFGPKAEYKLNGHALKALLHKNGYAAAKISKSKVHYR